MGEVIPIDRASEIRMEREGLIPVALDFLDFVDYVHDARTLPQSPGIPRHGIEWLKKIEIFELRRLVKEGDKRAIDEVLTAASNARLPAEDEDGGEPVYNPDLCEGWLETHHKKITSLER